MLWPTAQFIESHWSVRHRGTVSPGSHAAAETRAWPVRQEVARRIAEQAMPPSRTGDAQSSQECRQLQSSR